MNITIISILVLIYIVSIFICRWLNIKVYKIDKSYGLNYWFWVIPIVNIEVILSYLIALGIEKRIFSPKKYKSKFLRWFFYIQ
jgi:magnesium-transporting ATPase (P-type)